jgi:hypothetical protein
MNHRLSKKSTIYGIQVYILSIDSEIPYFFLVIFLKHPELLNLCTSDQYVKDKKQYLF